MRGRNEKGKNVLDEKHRLNLKFPHSQSTEVFLALVRLFILIFNLRAIEYTSTLYMSFI
jgi:hypothetical protein